MTFFRDSKIKTYQRMWDYMENKKPSVFVKNYDEGVARVKKVSVNISNSQWGFFSSPVNQSQLVNTIRNKIIRFLPLKGVCHEIFDPQFFFMIRTHLGP